MAKHTKRTPKRQQLAVAMFERGTNVVKWSSDHGFPVSRVDQIIRRYCGPASPASPRGLKTIEIINALEQDFGIEIVRRAA